LGLPPHPSSPGLSGTLHSFHSVIACPSMKTLMNSTVWVPYSWGLVLCT
jgi:hypothetical protein